MRYLFAIPHYFRPTAGGTHGALRGDPRVRAAALSECVAALRLAAGPHGGVLEHRPPPRVVAANRDPQAVVDVVVCTTGGHHALNQLSLPLGEFEHRPTNADPKLLGYECHAALRDGLGKYDWYGYLEDDLIVTDPWLFLKLGWFNKLVGDDAVLLPNRYEAGHRPGVPVRRLYVDGAVRPELTEPFQNRADRPTLTGQVMGHKVLFERPLNPHSGCFFLTAGQMAEWAARPYFLDRSAAFVGPLESAATLGVMRTFRVYKAAPPHADFCDIRHAGMAYLGLLPGGTPAG